MLMTSSNFENDILDLSYLHILTSNDLIFGTLTPEATATVVKNFIYVK